MNMGTITWFKCEDVLPPRIGNIGVVSVSDKVLVWGENGFPIQTYFILSINNLKVKSLRIFYNTLSFERLYLRSAIFLIFLVFLSFFYFV